MRKIKDRVVLGAVCGMIAGAIGRLSNAIAYKAGITDIRFNQLGAGLFLPKKEAKANTIEGKIIASLVNNSMVATSGVVVTYLLSITGRDKAMLKGTGIGTFQWIAIYGLMSRLGLTVKTNKPVSHMLSFMDHAIYGATMGLLVSKLGDDSLFPDKKVVKGEKLPLVAITNEQSPPKPSHFGVKLKKYSKNKRTG